MASDHHGLLIIPIHWLASSLCLLSTSKLVCDGRSGATWLPSHHPGGCYTLVVIEEIPPLLCKALWVPRKALYKFNKLLNSGRISLHSVWKVVIILKCLSKVCRQSLSTSDSNDHKFATLDGNLASVSCVRSYFLFQRQCCLWGWFSSWFQFFVPLVPLYMNMCLVPSAG